jgi:elongation factor G
MGSAYKNKGI